MKVITVALAVAVAVVASTRKAAVLVGENGEVPSALPKHAPCLKSCMCFSNHTEKISAVDVQCGDQNLSSVPAITDNHIQISVLNLSFNPLNNLTLSGYESAKCLYLQYCKLTSIDEKVFYGFKDLKVVDLSNNRLTSIPPNLFTDNLLLDTLILRENDLRDTDPNIPLLNGPASLSSLDLHHCKLSALSSVTFSSLPNLRILDISRNELILPDSEYLYFLLKLEDIKVERNPWKCGVRFEDLLCWMQRKLVAFHNEILECQHDNKTWETWPPGKRTSFCCGSRTTPSLTQVGKPDVTEIMNVNPNVSRPQEIESNLSVVFVAFFTMLSVLGTLSAICKDTLANTSAEIRPLSDEDETQFGDTQTASRELRGAVRNSQEGNEHKETEDENYNKIADTNFLHENVPLTKEEMIY